MKKVLIPDEYIPDYSLSKEEEQKKHAKHTKKSNEAFKKLEEQEKKLLKAPN
jgi:hypothetical protein